MSLFVPENARQEIKFVTFHTNRYRFMQWLQFHHAGFFRAYPERWVNNIYFDSNGYHSFEANISGTSSRAKIRYRWYGDLQALTSGALEIKRKRNFFGWKRIFQVSTGPNLATENWKRIKNLLREQISQEGQSWLISHPMPIIINRYRREYFVSRDRKVRVTVDNIQSLWDQRCGSTPNLIYKNTLPDMVVIEVKFDRMHRELASNYLQGIPLRVSRHSKYINGVNAVTGNGVWL